MLTKSPRRPLSPELQALSDAADAAWRRVFEEFAAEQRAIRERKGTWVGQRQDWHYQGSSFNMRGWGK